MNTFQVTDTIGTAGTITVDANTTNEEFSNWYGAGDEIPAEVAQSLESVLSGLFFTARDGDAEDFLGLKIEQA